MRINNANNVDIAINNQITEHVQQFQYLGSIVSVNGGTDEKIKKFKAAFDQLRPIWKSQL